MKPVPFRYRRVESIAEAFAELTRYGTEAAVLAGGQTLIAELNRRAVRPQVVVDIASLDALGGIRFTPDGMHLGALVRHRDVETLPARSGGWVVLRDAVRGIGSVPVRMRGTVGGSLAYADPAAQWCVVATALGGLVEVAGAQSLRRLRMESFLIGPRSTALAADELVVGLVIPGRPMAAGWSQQARQGDGPTVSACAAFFAADSAGTSGARVVLGGVGETPVDVPVDGVMPSGPEAGRWLTVAAESAAEAVPATASYRRGDLSHLRRLAAAVVRRAGGSALSRAASGWEVAR